MSDENYYNVPEDNSKKAKTFFTRGAQVAGAGQWDYAIEMYMQGLNMDPEDVVAHQALREISLKRKASGGKKIGMIEAMKFSYSGKDLKQNMLNAERQLAHDPGNTDLMTGVMENGHRSGCYDTALWMAAILVKALDESGAGKSGGDFKKYKIVRDTYWKLKRYKDAVLVCQRMVHARPDDADLKNEYKDLSAEEAMHAGKYKTAGSFRDSMRDRAGQEQLLESEKDVANSDVLEKMIREAESQLTADPNEMGKMSKVLESIRRLGTPEGEERALQRANAFFEKTKQFRYRMTALDIRLKQLVGEERALRAQVVAAPQDVEKKQAYQDFVKQRAEEELHIFEEVAHQYPTESKYKYEIANRYATLGRHLDSIPIYQEVVQDPKLRNEGTIRLGRAFFDAEFFDEAADTLKGLMESYQITGDAIAKEIYYWHGRSSEAKGAKADALKSYSQVMKWEFNFKDVQKRIKDLRASGASA